MKGLLLAALAAILMPSALAQTSLTPAQRKEVTELKDKARELTKQVSTITSKSDLQNSDEGIQLLKKVVDELAAIRERLKALEDARGDDSKRVDQTAKAVDVLEKTKFNGYMQFQYFNTDKHGSSQPNAFMIRRARLGLVQIVDPRATIRFSAEFAEDANRMDTRLKDAILDYDLAPDLKIPSRVLFGQMNVPLGYDIERSDADREIAERALYNRTMFTNERSRGVIVRADPTKHVEVGVGAMDALTVDDPEQTGLAPGQGSRIAGVGFVRLLGTGYRLGLSGFAGQRPAFTAGGQTSPEVNRWFTYLDGEYRPSVLPQLTIRAEAMFGHDRVPSATAAPGKTATNMTGFQANASYNLTAKHQLNFRWQQFDPDRSTGGNAVNGYGLSYQYFLSPFAKLQLTHELFDDESRSLVGQTHYYETTLRVQFRF